VPFATVLNYLKSRDFPIHLMVFWWIFWLAVAHTELNEYMPPSGATVLQYALLLLSFLAGSKVVKHRQALGFGSMSTQLRTLKSHSLRMRFALRSCALLCLVMLLAGLHLSGALTTDFIEYFAKLRMDAEGVASLTGIRVLDVLTKVLAFPLSYTVILMALAGGAQSLRWTLAVCVVNLLAFSYLWQVNYPMIHLFWFLVFYSLIHAHHHARFDARVMFVTAIVFAALLASAINRFGGDVLGGLQRYVFGYHLVGFAFYDHQYRDPNSILHAYTFGRSSMGFLDQVLEALSKVAGAGYTAASAENSTYNDQAVDIGLQEAREFNAFGTLLFTFFRDFHVLGVAVGGFAYGAATTHALYRSGRNWVCGAIFLLLASSWMMGMMVSPLEQAYFWFVVVALGAFSLVNRGVTLAGQR
jgi:oligosaccharide repeat unit polymerase